MQLTPHFSRVQQAVSTALIATLMLTPAFAQAPAQQPQPAKQSLYKFRVESELVLVNVVARDKQGNPVTDLKREDFTLLEDGKPQRVSSFDFDNLDTAPIVAAAGPSQQASNGPATPANPILTAKNAKQVLNHKP